MNEDEMGGVCSTCGGEEKCVKDFDEKGRRKEANRNTYNIKMDIRGRGSSSMGWIHLAQDMDQWQALVNTVMNFRVP
jgi:hypothetical protein